MRLTVPPFVPTPMSIGHLRRKERDTGEVVLKRGIRLEHRRRRRSDCLLRSGGLALSDEKDVFGLHRTSILSMKRHRLGSFRNKARPPRLPLHEVARRHR